MKHHCKTFIAALALVWFTISTAQADQSTRIVILGDSLTAGYGLAESEALPSRLQRALKEKGHDVIVVNAGVSGDTTAGGLARLDWALASAGGPVAGVIVALGGNDGLRGIPPTETRSNLSAIIGKLRAAQIPVLLAGMLAPPNLGEAYGAEFKKVFSSLGSKPDIYFYPFLLEGVAADPALNQADQIHPNPDGVAEIVRRLRPMVEHMLSAAPPTKG